MRSMFSGLTLMVASLVPQASASAQHGMEATAPARQYSTAAVGPEAAAEWRADLRFLLSGMQRIHPDVYNQTSRDEFEAAAARLESRMADMAAHEIIVELARIVALVGDGHTSLALYFAPGVDFHVLPLRLGIYDDGIHVEAADRRYAGMVGGRVVAFDDVPADSALALVTPLISRDSDSWIDAVAPNLLDRAEVLHALRLSDRIDGARITVEKDGRAATFEVDALDEPPVRTFGLPFLVQRTDDWIDARDSAVPPVPLHQRTFGDTYAFEYIEDRRLLYIGFHQVQNRPAGEDALSFFRRAMRFAGENEARIDRVLLDIRNNTGGEGGLLDAIVREIVRTREVDEPGRFFVAIGPRTFSAAGIFATQLDRYSSALFVGAPTGGSPNLFGNHEFLELPNSGIVVAVAPTRFQSGQPYDTRQSIVPRLAAVPTFADYASNRDPVLDAIETYTADSTWIEDIRTAIEAGDTAAAANAALAYDADPVNRWYPSTVPLNRLGYQFLRAGQIERALLVFRMNVGVHPEYANGWDSLGEAWAAAGENARAIEAYRHALELDPQNGNARQWLERLGGR